MGKTKHSIIENEQMKGQLLEWLSQQKTPFSLTYTPGKKRSTEQNKLQRKWCVELSEQGDMSGEEYRGYCKLHFGIPILRRDNENFRLLYDNFLKKFLYEQKLILMMEPYDLAVTRHMATKQKAEYLDRIYEHFTGEGFTLTVPKPKG